MKVRASFTRTASADNQHILVSCCFGVRRSIVHGQAFRLGEDDVIGKNRVNIGRNVCLSAPAGGAVFHVLPELLCVLALDVDRQTDSQGNQNAYAQVDGMEAGHGRFKRQHQPLHDVQCLPGKVRSGSQPHSLPDFGGKQGDEHIGNVGKNQFLVVDGFYRSSSFRLVRSTTAFLISALKCSSLARTEGRSSLVMTLAVYSLKAAFMASVSGALKKIR